MKPAVFVFFSIKFKNLRRTELTQHFASMLWNWKFHQENIIMKNYKVDISGSFVVVNEFFESCYATAGMVKVFSHSLAFFQHDVSVFTKLNFFGEHLFIVLDIEGSNILTLSQPLLLKMHNLIQFVVRFSGSNPLLVRSISLNPLSK